MTDAHRPAHLSASRLSAYERCPQVYRNRYVLKLIEPPSFEREFGTAVHAGLEAHYRGLDYEMAYLQAWRQSQKICRSDGVLAPNWLTARGLELIEMTRKLGLVGEPERRIGVIVAGISVPLIGYADLWGEGVVYDFKTAGWPWTQERADREMFQPVLYAQAYAEAHDGQYPVFTFVVLPRNGGGLVTFDATRSIRQIVETFQRAREIHQAIEAQELGCTCDGKRCKTVQAA